MNFLGDKLIGIAPRATATVSELFTGVFQALVVAEIVALIMARLMIEADGFRQLGDSWHKRLEVLTRMVLPLLMPALLLVAAILAVVMLVTAIGYDVSSTVVLLIMPLMAGVLTWWVARDADWRQLSRPGPRIGR